MKTTLIPPEELVKRREQGESFYLVDVRTPVEFREVHAESATNVPLDALDESRIPSDGTVCLICRTGSRASKAAKKLEGHPSVLVVEGGTESWVDSGLPVVRGQKAMSLERQVRIAAGSLVFIGSLLTLFNPYFFILPVFVGAGLVFAGVTDTCGMGMLLAKMPWNQVRSEKSCLSESCSS